MMAAVDAAALAAGVGGLGLGKQGIELTNKLFKLQMRQDKRLWAADWAESSWRHGETIAQSAQHHAESQGMAAASYFQSERMHRQNYRQTEEQDNRSFEMSWRAELREALRDELGNLNVRFYNVMLCDTVCLGCSFGLLAANPPVTTHALLLLCYVTSLGLSICLFTVSLWTSVIVVGRLNEHTASIMERKLFFDSAQLQKQWSQQLNNREPTSGEIFRSVQQAFAEWVETHCRVMGDRAVKMLALGVVCMFVSAGCLVHIKYQTEFENDAGIWVASIFWSFVFVTASTVMSLSMQEERMVRRKEGPYAAQWKNNIAEAEDLFAKVKRSGQELRQSGKNVQATTEGIGRFTAREQKEKEECAATTKLKERFNTLRQQSQQRKHIRGEVVKLITRSVEEREAMTDELTATLNKILYGVDEVDEVVQTTVEEKSAPMQPTRAEVDDGRASSGALPNPPLGQMPRAEQLAPISQPMDANCAPVVLCAVRRKLGEVARTLLLRILNASDEPLRLISGRHIIKGKYVENMPYTLTCPKLGKRKGEYNLAPIDEIPPRTEVIVAASSKTSIGGIATSGLEGQLVYATKDGSWEFAIAFESSLMGSQRSVKVVAEQNGSKASADVLPCIWSAMKEDLDRKANSEVLVTIDSHRAAVNEAKDDDEDSAHRYIKSGFIQKLHPALRVIWRRRWFVLSSEQLMYYADTSADTAAESLSLDKVVKIEMQGQILEVRTHDAQVGSWYLSFEGDTVSMQEWADAIEEACEEASAAAMVGHAFLARRSGMAASARDSSSLVDTAEQEGEPPPTREQQPQPWWPMPETISPEPEPDPEPKPKPEHERVAAEQSESQPEPMATATTSEATATAATLALPSGP